MISVLIVEDHQSMCDAIKAAFDNTKKYQTIGSLPRADMAVAFCERFHPDLILMDVCTESEESGIAAASEIKEKFPDIKVIVMTGFDELSYIPRAKAARADGFIYKSKSLNFFIEVADKILSGSKYFPEEKTIPVPKGKVPLSDREMEVLRLMCKNLSNQEIAEELFISENTVKFHKKNMMDKTGFSKPIDLAFYMISNGWINPLY